MIGSRFIVIFLAAFASNAAEAFGKVRRVGKIQVKGVEFSPSWRDYWSIDEYCSEEIFDLTESKYQVLRVEITSGGSPKIKVKALDELEGYYYVLAISKLEVKYDNAKIVWTTTCNRSLLGKEKIEKLYPNAIKLILVSSVEKDKIQFQCPTFGKGRLNISFLPDGQSKPWTPRRGKLGLYHLRMRPFRGLQLLFPKLPVKYSAEVADEVLEMKGATSPTAKMITTILLDKLHNERHTNLNSCWRLKFAMDVAYKMLHALEYNDKWVIETIRRLRQLHKEMDEPCDKLGLTFVPHLLDYWHGIVSRKIRLVDYPYVVLTFDSGKKLDYKLYKTLPSIDKVVLVAASKLIIPQEARGRQTDVTKYDLVWNCGPYKIPTQAKKSGFKKLSRLVQLNPNCKNYILIKPGDLKRLKSLKCEKEGNVKFSSKSTLLDEFEDEEYPKMSDIVNTFATGLEMDVTTMQDNLEALKKLVTEDSLYKLNRPAIKDALARFATVFGEYERGKSRSPLVRQAKQCLVPDGLFSTVFLQSFNRLIPN